MLSVETARQPLGTTLLALDANSLTRTFPLNQDFTCGVAPAVAMLSRIPVSACMFFIR